MENIGFGYHDHAHCITETMQNAEEYCRAERLRFTPVRRRVLELLLKEHRALGAYEILEFLANEGLGSQPPVAYRALDFLVQNGLAHRIERLNAYAACAHLGKAHAPAFLICKSCQKIAELDGEQVNAVVTAEAESTGFAVERIAVEIEGVCPACTGAGA